MSGGGRFDFDDGGTYCGGWEDGKAHGHGICTGPKGQGEYAGAWQFGFESSGVYTWPSGNCFEGQWMQGKRHGAGIERKGRWIYRGEWTQGFKGRYGVRMSTSSGAKYEGTWTTGLQDGYGVETYADGVGGQLNDRDGQEIPQLSQASGTYQGQWLRGMRHGYGVRQSVPYGLASHYRPKALRDSLTSLRSEAEEDHVVKDRDRKVDETRGGFVLRARSDESPSQRRRSIFDKHGRSSLRKVMSGLKIRKQKSTGDIQESPRRPTGSVRSTVSNISHASQDSSKSGVSTTSVCTDSNLSFVSQDDITDVNVTETYMGEWKNDKRSGFGISERSDGLKYEGEWYNNKKYGYGVTTFKEGTKEEGKYKNNVLISSGKKSKLFLIRSSKMRERVDNAVAAAQRAAQIAQQKGDIAISRMANAQAKAEQADMLALQAKKDAELARIKAREFAPDFHQPGDLADTEQGNKNKVLDSAIAGGVSNVVDNLHKYGDDARMGRDYHSPQDMRDGDRYGQPVTPHQQPQAYSKPPQPYDQRGYQPYGAQPYGQPQQQQQQHQQQQQQPQQQQNIYANDMYRSHPDDQRGRSYERLPSAHNHNTTDRYGDSYRTNHRDDSGLGRDLESPMYQEPHYGAPPMDDRMGNRMGDHRMGDPRMGTPMSDRMGPMGVPKGGSIDRQMGGPMAHQNHRAQSTDRSPDSGLSDSDDYRYKSRPLQRRKTLPSIMKGEPITPNKTGTLPPPHERNPLGTQPIKAPSQPSNIGSALAAASFTAASPASNISSSTGGPVDRYIIENGIRKRVHAEVYTSPQRLPPKRDPLDKPKELPSRYKMETQMRSSKGANRGSLPDVSVCGEITQNQGVMPREEVHKMSEKRRAELRRLQDEDERRRQQEIVLRLTDLKDWCQQRQLLMLVIALNVSLATMFFNLLSQ